MAKRKPSIDAVKALVTRNRDFLQRSEANAVKNIQNATAKLSRKIGAMTKTLETAPDGKLLGLRTNLAQAQKIHMRLGEVFDEIYKPAYSAVVKGLDSVAANALSSLGIGGSAAQFTDIDKDVLKALKTAVYDTYEAYGDMARTQVATAMYDQIIGGASFPELTDVISGILEGGEDARGRSMTAYAEQFAGDSMMQFNRDVTTMKAADIGLDHFIYYGDVIRTTREFCEERVGNIYTLAEIESWDELEWDGKSGPPLTHCGGYNCRHSWVAVDPEWFPEGSIETQNFNEE